MKTIDVLCNELTTGATNALFEKRENDSEGTMRLLTGSSVNLNGEIVEQQLSSVTIAEGKSMQRFLLQAGDVVLLAKGNSIRAGYATEQYRKTECDCFCQFYRLKTKPKRSTWRGASRLLYLRLVKAFWTQLAQVQQSRIST